MMKMDYLTDVTIVCDDQKVIKAHKIILSACSPVFKTIIDNVSPETAVIYLRGFKYDEMEALLEFMYNGQVTINQDKMDEFITVAKNLQIKELYFNNSHLQTVPTDIEANMDDEIDAGVAAWTKYDVKQEHFESKPSAMVNHVRRIHTDAGIR